jgi:hypothetical protein
MPPLMPPLPIKLSPKAEPSWKRFLSPELPTQPPKHLNWHREYNEDWAQMATNASCHEDTLEEYYSWHQQEYGRMPNLWEDPGNKAADHLAPIPKQGLTKDGPPSPRQQAKFIEICKKNNIKEGSRYYPRWA